MARTSVKTLLVNREAGSTGLGHVDGLGSRLLKILNSFGLGEKIRWNQTRRFTYTFR